MRGLPILLVESTPHLPTLLRDAVASSGSDHPIMVISQPGEARQYLRDACLANRCPVALVIDGGRELSLSLVAWAQSQLGCIAMIPVVALWTAPSSPDFHRIDAVVREPSPARVSAALRDVLGSDGQRVPS